MGAEWTMVDVKTEEIRDLNRLPRRRIKQDENINIGGGARLNQHAECPTTGQGILSIPAIELVEKLGQYLAEV